MNKIKMDLTKELPYAVEESINRLRINVSFLGNEIKKIMVVSTMPNEGKSFVTLQMWRQMASAGIKSVFVDGDMRNSVIVNKYGIEKEDGSEMKGLAHYLAEEFPLENVVYNTPLENGDIIPNVENIINPSSLAICSINLRKITDMYLLMHHLLVLYQMLKRLVVCVMEQFL